MRYIVLFILKTTLIVRLDLVYSLNVCLAVRSGDPMRVVLPSYPVVLCVSGCPTVLLGITYSEQRHPTRSSLFRIELLYTE